MKKQLLASLLSLFLVAGLAPMAAASTAPCCSGSSTCPMDKADSCAYKVLTKEECQRFCKAKAAAIAKDPSLAKPENKCKLCRAIVKADPSMKPICMKLRKNCRQMKRDAAKCHQKCQGMSTSQSSSSSSAAEQSASSASQQSSNSSSQQSADAGSSSSSMSSSVAAHAASASGAQTQSSSAASAN